MSVTKVKIEVEGGEPGFADKIARMINTGSFQDDYDALARERHQEFIKPKMPEVNEPTRKGYIKSLGIAIAATDDPTVRHDLLDILLAFNQ